MQLPIGAESDFAGVIDLVEMKALIWKSENLGAEWDIVEIPADLKAQAEEYREKLIEPPSKWTRARWSVTWKARCLPMTRSAR
jgi:translation elongation factor EF-G